MFEPAVMLSTTRTGNVLSERGRRWTDPLLVAALLVSVICGASAGERVPVSGLETDFQRQRDALKREQDVYRRQQVPGSQDEAADLDARLERQRHKQRQLQQHLRQSKPVIRSGTGFRPPAENGRRGEIRLRQERQRLNLKIQRRSWKSP